MEKKGQLPKGAVRVGGKHVVAAVITHKYAQDAGGKRYATGDTSKISCWKTGSPQKDLLGPDALPSLPAKKHSRRETPS